MSINSHANDNYSGVYQLTNSDLEGMLDFELFFQDKSGNFVIQRQNSKITNNCFVAGNLKIYHASSILIVIVQHLFGENCKLFHQQSQSKRYS